MSFGRKPLKCAKGKLFNNYFKFSDKLSFLISYVSFATRLLNKFHRFNLIDFCPSGERAEREIGTSRVGPLTLR